MTPRPYQIDCIAAIANGWADYRRQLIVLPTGGGKTVVFSFVAQAEAQRGGKTLILAHRDELITQAAAKLHSATGIRAEREKANDFAGDNAGVVVASIQTLMREKRLSRWAPDHFSLVICDEAHHSISKSWQYVLSRFAPHARILGVTATPDRGDKKNLGSFYDFVAYEIGLLELIKQGHLAPITVRTVPLNIDLSAIKSTAGDLDANALGSALDPYLAEIASAIATHACGRKVLAFVPLIATSIKFVAACRAAGINARHVDGMSEDRAEILGDFENHEFDLLSNAMLLTEGYDCPPVDCVVVLRPTRSRPLYAQMVGRGTRTFPLKDNLLLLDFLWMHKQHSITRPAHLIASDELEAETMTAVSVEAAGGGDGERDLMDIAGDAVAKREEALRLKLEQQRKKRGSLISAEEFALLQHDPALADYLPTMEWESKPLTEPQIRYLKQNKIDPDTVHGRGHASKILAAAFAAKPLTLASARQRGYMRSKGAPNWETATAREAATFFAQQKQTN